MPDPKVQIVITADGSQAGREVNKAWSELMKIGVGSVTVGNLLADMGRKALEVGKDLARFPLDAALATGRYVEQLENLKAETGLAADEQQAYDVILNRTGLGLQDLSGMWRILSQNVIAARDPLSDAAYNFRRLGIELKGTEGPAEVLELISAKLNELPDGFRKNTLATELLGRSGAQFLPAFKEGLSGAAAEAKRLGTVLDQEARAKAADFDAATDDLHKAWEGLTHQIGALAAPALADLARNLTEATAKTSKWAAELGGAKDKVDSLVDSVRRMGPGATQFVPPPTLGGGGLPRGTAERPSQEVLDQLGLIAAQDQAARDAKTAGERQEALGRAAVLRTQKMLFDKEHMAELQPGLAATFDIDQVQARERASEKASARPDLSGLTEMQRGVLAIRELMPELSADGALLVVQQNLETGHQAVVQSIDDWQSYRDELSDAVDHARVLEAAQASLYQTEAGFIGATDTMRRLSFQRLAEEEAQKRQAILDTYGESQRGLQKLEDLELDTSTKRMAIVRQYPDFWEQQLQAVVQSNAFSLGSIVSTWSSGLAQAIVQHRSFSETVQAAAQQTQIALLQAALNTAVQGVASWILAESTRVAATEAANTVIIGSNAATAAGTVGLWATATMAMKSMMLTLATGILAITGFVVSAITTVLEAISFVLATVFQFVAQLLYDVAAAAMSIPYVGPVIAFALGALATGVAALGIALPAIVAGIGAGLAASVAALGGALPALADGGIFTGAAIVAEAGTPEVAIPLDSRGKRFMNQLGFGGSGGTQHIVVQVGDDVLAEKVLKGMPRMVRMKLGGAF